MSDPYTRDLFRGSSNDLNPDPYRLPDDGSLNVVNFSGGRSSAYMLGKIVARYRGQLPEGTHVCFANTGVEREETLVFVERVGRHFGVPITCLEYEFRPEAEGGVKDPRHRHRVVTVETAARNHESFETMIRAKARLPNVAQRFCTSQLKVNPVRWWLQRELGWMGRYRNILGIRYDEPKRWGKALMEECWSEYPMVHDGVTSGDVEDFWRRQPFDLEIESRQGNCDLCFLKGREKLVELIREEPERAEWWIRMERQVHAQFSQRHTYAELRKQALGETVVAFSDEDRESIDCFCGD